MGHGWRKRGLKSVENDFRRGGTKKIDACRVCGGDGSACRSESAGGSLRVGGDPKAYFLGSALCNKTRRDLAAKCVDCRRFAYQACHMLFIKRSVAS